jgi:hypothetical protein
VSTHPYWAYEAVPGSLTAEREKKALAEGRRAFALELAVQRPSVAEDDVDRARRFEAYLAGEPVEDVNGAPLDWERNTGPADRGAL